MPPIDKGLNGEVCNLLERLAVHVQKNTTLEQECPQFEEGMQRERCHVGFGPPLPSFLDVFLEFHPSEIQQKNMMSKKKMIMYPPI